MKGLEVLNVINDSCIAQDIVDATAVVSSSMVKSIILLIVHKFKILLFTKLFKLQSVLICSSITAKTYDLGIKVASDDGPAINCAYKAIQLLEKGGSLLLIFGRCINTNKVGVIIYSNGCDSILKVRSSEWVFQSAILDLLLY